MNGAVSKLSSEPFRIFFPAAAFAGILGVLTWPLHFIGFYPIYPAEAHGRVMAFGFLGGFIVGFLCTAAPRLLSAPALRGWEWGSVFCLQQASVVAFLCGKIVWGELLCLMGAALLWLALARRFFHRGDLPPPGFLPVLLAYLCLGASLMLSLNRTDMAHDFPGFSERLFPLLGYQGFVILPFMGMGPYLIPRFFSAISKHDFPRMTHPNREWGMSVLKGGVAGGLFIAGCVLEAAGWDRTGLWMRAWALVGYMGWEVSPIFRGDFSGRFAVWIRRSMAAVAGAMGLMACMPMFRVPWLHGVIAFGLTLILVSVATRVIWGHAGLGERLMERNRWMTWTGYTIALGVVTRISGDWWPKILPTHFSYGAIFWSVGILVWIVLVFPALMRWESSEDGR